MLILSQDNEKVIKRLINFDNIIYLSVDKININYSVITFKDNTMNENKLKDYNCLLGVYNTEERAKEVLQEIISKYKTTLYNSKTNETVVNVPKVYEMPIN